MADFLVDNFTGAGNLSTHVPDTNTWVSATTLLDNGGDTAGGAPTSNPTLAALVLSGAGTMKYDLTNGAGSDRLALVPGTPPVANNYYLETVLKLPAFGSAPPSLTLYFGFNGRVTADSTNPGFKNFVSSRWLLEAHSFSGQWQLNVEGNYAGGDFSGPMNFDDFWNHFDSIPLGTSAQTLTLRMQFSGRSWSLWVNGVKLANTEAVTDFVWYGTAGYDTGSVGFGARFQNYSGTYFDIEFDKIAGGDLPAAPGAFWQDFVKSAETLS